MSDTKKLEQYIKPFIQQEVLNDGQSEKYFENIWTIWWGMMDTNFKNGLVKAFASQSKMYSEDEVRRAIEMAREMDDEEERFLYTNLTIRETIKK